MVLIKNIQFTLSETIDRI